MQQYSLDRPARERRNKHKAFVVWFTGLSGSGKSTMANLLEQHYFEAGYNAYVLDGDNVRAGINRDLDFSKEGRKENIRRVAEIARLFSDAGIITITAFISPYIEDRQMAREIIGSDRFVEVFIDASLECCIRRDVKGLYAQALSGSIKSFTGVSDIYEPPTAPQIHLDTESQNEKDSLYHLAGSLNTYL